MKPAASSLGRAARLGTLILFLLGFSGTPAAAAPLLAGRRQAGPLEVYPDDSRPGLFYLPPGELELSVAGGVPDFHLLIARYTGTVAGGDSGATLLRGLLTFRVEEKAPKPADLAAATKALAAGGSQRRIELRPLPIGRLEAALIWQSLTPTADAASIPAPEPHRLAGGRFEAGDAPSGPGGAIFKARFFSLRLTSADAQLLADSLAKGRLLFSLGYAFYVEGAADPADELSGPPELVEALEERLAERGEAVRDQRLVRAGALAITADLAVHPQLLQKVDLNDSAPPAWAMVEIYCFDFAEKRRPELAEKSVELRAAGVAGRDVTVRAIFSDRQRELYARTVRFPLAVRLDLPYSFRTTEIDWNGESRISPWQKAESWVSLLDVSSPAAESPADNDPDSGDEDVPPNP